MYLKCRILTYDSVASSSPLFEALILTHGFAYLYPVNYVTSFCGMYKGILVA